MAFDAAEEHAKFILESPYTAITIRHKGRLMGAFGIYDATFEWLYHYFGESGKISYERLFSYVDDATKKIENQIKYFSGLGDILEDMNLSNEHHTLSIVKEALIELDKNTEFDVKLEEAEGPLFSKSKKFLKEGEPSIERMKVHNSLSEAVKKALSFGDAITAKIIVNYERKHPEDERTEKVNEEIKEAKDLFKRGTGQDPDEFLETYHSFL